MNYFILAITIGVTVAAFVALSYFALKGENIIEFDELPKRKVRSDKGKKRVKK